MQKEAILAKELSTSTIQNMFESVYLLMKRTKQCRIGFSV